MRTPASSSAWIPGGATMSYSSEIARILAERWGEIRHVEPPSARRASPNLDFWLDEVRHALGVIDGYGPRFERLKSAQLKFASEHGTTEFLLCDPRHTKQSAAPPKRTPSSELNEARRSLCDATYHFLVRCYKEGFIAEPALREACGSLEIGVDARDLRNR